MSVKSAIIWNYKLNGDESIVDKYYNENITGSFEEGDLKLLSRFVNELLNYKNNSDVDYICINISIDNRHRNMIIINKITSVIYYIEPSSIYCKCICDDITGIILTVFSDFLVDINGLHPKLTDYALKNGIKDIFDGASCVGICYFVLFKIIELVFVEKDFILNVDVHEIVEILGKFGYDITHTYWKDIKEDILYDATNVFLRIIKIH